MFGIKYGVDGVAAGYDKIRFLGPVFFGDTIRVEYGSRRWTASDCARTPSLR
jgi:acyl dehydratase